jgi:uncharacterized protein (TIGR02266 family)
MSDEPTGEEQRRFDREPVTLVVEYDGADELVVDYTENLSSGGTFVHTTRPFEVGTQVHLRLSFPGLLSPIALEGVVRWSRDSAAGEPGAGIEFTNFDDRARARIDEIVQRIRARDPQVVDRVIRVLVVEDNPHVAQLITDGLRGSGRVQLGDNLSFHFRTAVNGAEALELLRTETFDALIVDIYLPVLDGASVIAQAREDERTRTIPIIAVSAGGDSARQQALSAGADFFLDKPMRLRQIIDTMRQLMPLGDQA